MIEFDPSTLADAHVADRFDVFISFTRADPDGRQRVEEIEQALAAGGLRVFRDVAINEFDGITGELVDAIAGSRVLLAYYSRVLPTRYACQWELTAAFIAAQREGDPCRRVLAINPEADTTHLAPIELANARFFEEPVTPESLTRLVARVRAKVDATDGPFGVARPAIDPARVPERVLRPRRTVGRYPEMWRIHSALHAMDFAAVQQPDSQPAVVVKGLPGIGKTSLAEQYAYLYRDAYPGGIFWTGPFGHHEPGSVLSHYHLTLSQIATDKLGTDVRGISLERLRGLIADGFSRAGEKVLWIVDDVPAELPSNLLDELLIPSPAVRTILTSRAAHTTWDVPAVRLNGLTEDEGLRLFTQIRQPYEDEPVIRFVRRCGGHPIAIRTVASRSLPLSEEDNPADTVQTIRDELDRLGRLELDVLGVAAALAPVPFPTALVMKVLRLKDFDARRRLERAADVLTARSFVDVVDGGWQVHALVTEAVRQRTDLQAVAVSAVPALLDLLGSGRAGRRDFLLQHAEALAARSVEHKTELLRPVAEAYEEQGDFLAAARVYVNLEPRSTDDLLAAARVEIGCGHYSEAIVHARTAGGYRGRLLAAQALDSQGRYAEADNEFWTSNAGQMPEDERLPATVAMAVAERLRGRPREAVALLEPVIVELREAPFGELTAVAKLEYARSLQLLGKARVARVVAREVVDGYQSAGRERHARCAEAETVHAEAMLTLDLTELNADPKHWEQAEAELREVKARYEKTYGADNPLTLTAAVRADRALLALGRPKRALAALGRVEQDVIRVLGADHPLRYRVRHGMGLAHGQLREFARQAEILEPILDPQIRLLGLCHPETVESHLDLGIALAMSGIGSRERAIGLVDTAARNLRLTLGSTVDLSAKAMTAKWVVRLPKPLLSAIFVFERLFGPDKNKSTGKGDL